MSLFKVKVCGITRLNDAQTAVELGADLLGFIFYKRSKRYISAADALKIVKKIPPTTARVGVFVNEDSDRILKIACMLRLDFIQLSGNERDRQLVVLHQEGFKVIQAFHITEQNHYKTATESKADLILIDNAGKDGIGGTGKTFDWNLKPPKRIPNLVLAGGINVDNVQQGLEIFNPLVIDVNSGVEFKPGIKSAEKMDDFFKKCNALRYDY